MKDNSSLKEIFFKIVLPHPFHGKLRLYFHILIFLSLTPGIVLASYSLATKTHSELLIGLLTIFSVLHLSWFAVERMILRRVNEIIGMTNRLMSGDYSARSGKKNQIGIAGELTQLTLSIDRMAEHLERQEKYIRMRANQVTALSELANEIATDKDVNIAINQVLEKIISFLNTSQATLYLYDAENDDLVLTAVKGIELPLGIRIKMGEGPVGRAATTRELVIVAEYSQQGIGSNTDKREPYSTRIHIPMMNQGELIGVLGVADTRLDQQFYDEEIRLLFLFAGQAASAIKSFHSVQDSQQRLTIMETVNEISTSIGCTDKVEELIPILLGKVKPFVNATNCDLWLFNPTDGHLHLTTADKDTNQVDRCNPQEGLIGRVYSSGFPEYLLEWPGADLNSQTNHPDYSRRICCAFIPIRTSNVILGVLALEFRPGCSLSEDQKLAIEYIGKTVGNAIHRISLHEQAVKQLDRISALHHIDLAITSYLDQKRTLEILLIHATKQLGIDAACVYVYNPKEHRLEYSSSRGFSDNFITSTDLPIEGSYCGVAINERRTVFVPNLQDPQNKYRCLQSYSAEGFVAHYAVPLVVRNQIKGVLEIYHRSNLDNRQEWLDYLDALATQAAIVIESASLYSDLHQANFNLTIAYDSTIEGWSRALDFRDNETEGHSQRVTDLTLQLAKALSIDDGSLIHIRRGSLLHDIGKLGIPDHILFKPGTLSVTEKLIIQKHPMIAYELLKPIAYLSPALEIPYCHHEKWDGTGYPRKLKGEEIPLPARIFAIADVWDALTSDRPYRKKWNNETALNYIQAQTGKQFDPRIVKTFLQIMK